MEATQPQQQLVDRFGRSVSYVRLSVTDRCDLRCVYCMPEKMKFVPRSQLLTLEEMEAVGRAFIKLGVDKIRVTGGEPLVRQNILQLFQNLGAIEELRDLTLTTNATQLKKYARPLKDAGVTRINISLDTIRPDRFHDITRVGDLAKTLEGIDAAIACDFEQIKINTVVLKNYNHDEILDLVNFCIDRGIDISFIEEMPLGQNDHHDRAVAYYSSDQILEDLEQHFELVPSTMTTAGPTRYYRLSTHENTRVGFISPHSHNFCDSCNRVRVTAEGRLLLCLGQEHSMDLRHVMRAHPGEDDMLEQALIDSMQIKPRGHDFNLNSQEILLRHMNLTGG
ncbi:MAG: GTP 3',8-cyclase MoaA [Gammaproteobacteria bacterium]|nr:MAG: GTP 3',8-cyclase MoaA [Gammaproteobacteria bacterium]